MNEYKKGDIAWIIDSTIYIKEVEVINIKYDIVTIKYKKENFGTRVRINCLYRTKEEAERVMNSNKKH